MSLNAHDVNSFPHLEEYLNTHDDIPRTESLYSVNLDLRVSFSRRHWRMFSWLVTG